jgi:hypothetical protein
MAGAEPTLEEPTTRAASLVKYLAEAEADHYYIHKSLSCSLLLMPETTSNLVQVKRAKMLVILSTYCYLFQND